MVHITLYNYNNRKDIINKTLTDGVSVKGLIRDGFDIVKPTVIIRWDNIFTYSYLYIEELNRYYFVDSFRVLENKTYELTLSVDVLMTYRDKILTATATVSSSDSADKYISSREDIYNVQPNFEKLTFPKQQFDKEGELIMVTIKGD